MAVGLEDERAHAEAAVLAPAAAAHPEAAVLAPVATGRPCVRMDGRSFGWQPGVVLRVRFWTECDFRFQILQLSASPATHRSPYCGGKTADVVVVKDEELFLLGVRSSAEDPEAVFCRLVVSQEAHEELLGL